MEAGNGGREPPCQGHVGVGRSGDACGRGSEDHRARRPSGAVDFASPLLESDLGLDLKACALVLREGDPCYLRNMRKWSGMYTFTHNLFRVFKAPVDGEFIKHGSVGTVSDWELV